LRAARKSHVLIFAQRRFNRAGLFQAVCQHYRIFECLTCSLAKVRSGRVRFISQ
jgi:hypothetical protein